MYTNILLLISANPGQHVTAVSTEMLGLKVEMFTLTRQSIRQSGMNQRCQLLNAANSDHMSDRG